MISKSPQRHTFQQESYLKRKDEKDEPVNEAYLEMWDNIRNQDAMREADPEWQKNNLEYDLRTTDWILEKARSRDAYAQNIYAALCNMRWQKLDVLPILKDEFWSCSWRHAGGIVADMLQKGDYIDWYCSGIRGDESEIDYEGALERGMDLRNYVPESVVTEEIRADFQKLGWVPSEWPDD